MCTVCRFPCADLFACIHVSRKSHVSHGGSGRRAVEELRREVYLITFDKMGWRLGEATAPRVVRRPYLGPGGSPKSPPNILPAPLAPAGLSQISTPSYQK